MENEQGERQGRTQLSIRAAEGPGGQPSAPPERPSPKQGWQRGARMAKASERCARNTNPKARVADEVSPARLNEEGPGATGPAADTLRPGSGPGQSQWRRGSEAEPRSAPIWATPKPRPRRA
eukprot:12818800-Alexandrium_andersonii.AAC.1